MQNQPHANAGAAAQTRESACTSSLCARIVPPWSWPHSPVPRTGWMSFEPKNKSAGRRELGALLGTIKDKTVNVVLC